MAAYQQTLWGAPDWQTSSDAKFLDAAKTAFVENIEALAALAGPATARRTDPLPSHIAARMVEATGKAGSHRARLYQAIQSHPGLTCAQLADMIGIDRAAASKRIPELVRAGIVRKVGEVICPLAKTKQGTWRVA
jgi:CRP-like cAMP-binding protein